MQRKFNFQYSAYLAIALILIHVAAIVSVLLIFLPIWSQAALIFFLMINLLHHLWCNAWLYSPSSIVALMLEKDRLMLALRNGKHVSGRVMPESLITPSLTVLSVLPEGSYMTHSVVILPDSLEAESFRQLRVFLKWSR